MTIQNESEKIIEIKDLSFSYETQDVLKNLNFSVSRGSFLAVIGTNGSGKSTLLKLLLGELAPQKGEISLFGNDIKDFCDFQKIGYIAQTKEFNSGFPATVWEVVCAGLPSSNFLRRPDKKSYLDAQDALKRVGMEEYKNRLIGALSGGQMQRVILARLLCSRAELFLLDEPTGALDAQGAQDLMEILKDLNTQKGITVIMVTHEIEKALDYTDKVFLMNEGKLYQTQSGSLCAGE